MTGNVKYSSQYWTHRSRIIELVLQDPSIPFKDLDTLITHEFGKSKIQQIIRNHVNGNRFLNGREGAGVCGSRYDGFVPLEFAASLERVKCNLQALIKRRVDRLCLEMKAPLVRTRSAEQQTYFTESREDALNGATEAFTILYDIFPSKPWNASYLKTCLYDDQDLYEALKAIQITDVPKCPSLWSALSIPISTITLHQIKLKYPELAPSTATLHLGLHDLSIAPPHQGFAELHLQRGEKCVLDDNMQEIRLYARCGISACLRPAIWRKLMQSQLATPQAEGGALSSLDRRIVKNDLMIDRVLHVDSKHAQNDDSYFVFEEVARDVLLYWSRDELITEKLLEHYPKLALNNLPMSSGIYPIWGISLYTLPVCYLYSSASEAYITFRELYTQYFFKLHTITESSGSILYLCVLFENLLKQKDARLYFYLTYELDIKPLDIAFIWILYAFVGVLEIDQVLLMWDRMIAFNSTDIIALTAAALFHYRRESILKCESGDEVLICFSENGLVKWVPLIQNFLA